MSPPVQSSTPAWLVTTKFIALAVLWGSSFFFIEIALRNLSWGQIAWSRVVAGGVFMAVMLLLTREKLPKEPVVWAHISFAGIIGVGIPFVFYPWAQQFINSATATIYNGLTPIMTTIVAVYVLRVEKFNRNQLLGVLIGLVGLIIIIGPWNITELGGYFWGQMAAIAAALMYGVSGTWLKKFVFPRGVSSRAISIIQIGSAAIFILLWTPLLTAGPVTLDWTTVVAIAVIGFGGTGIAYFWYNDVLNNWGPTRTSGVTYIMPIVGVFLGVVFLGEALHWNEPVGGLIVIVGVLVMRLQPKQGALA